MRFKKILKEKNFTLFKNNKYPIYKICADNLYDLGMLFIRHQEFYESPKFKNKKFSMMEYMRWYVLDNDISKSIFTYCEDWCGYNIPSTILKKSVLDTPDINLYDIIFDVLYQQILSDIGDSNFYLIGCLIDDSETMEHEIAHTFFFLNKEYKKEMKEAVKNLNKKEYNALFKFLKNGYRESVFVDEIQAYLSTGIPSELVTIISDKTIKKIEKIFYKYYNNI